MVEDETPRADEPAPTPRERARLAFLEIQSALQKHGCDVYVSVRGIAADDGSLLVRPDWKVVPLS